MDIIAIISLFAGVMGLTYGLISVFTIKKLVAHLKEQGVIDKNFSIGGGTGPRL